MDPDPPARDYLIVASPLAVRDLAEINAFIAADDPAAERFVRELVQRTRILSTFPELGKVVPEFAESGNARELIYRSYRIVYRVDHHRRRVEVARFWHGARGKPQL